MNSLFEFGRKLATKELVDHADEVDTAVQTICRGSNSFRWAKTFLEILILKTLADPVSTTDAVVLRFGAELLFEMLSQRYERGSTLITSNLPFQEWTEILGSERLTGALLDRLTHHVHILEMNGDSYRLKQSRRKRPPSSER